MENHRQVETCRDNMLDNLSKKRKVGSSCAVDIIV